MRKDTKILIVLILIIVIMVALKKPIQKALSRGYRNKNPGNIRRTADLWKGEVQGTDPDFKTFKTMGYGYRAMLVLLHTYFGQGLNTISKIISTYAPSNENATENYINVVSHRSGLAPDTVLDFNDKLQMKNIISAMSYMENGIDADPSDIENGFKLYQA